MLVSQHKKKHERPKGEPPENVLVAVPEGTKRAAIMATGAVPSTNGGQPKMQKMGLADISEKTFTIMPNMTTEWLNCNKMWLQPDDENDAVCRNCDCVTMSCHSRIEQCEDGGSHSMQYHQMACELAASSVEPDRTFKWVPYSVQVQMREDEEAKCMTATVTRTCDTRGIPVIRPRPATGAAAGCYNVNVSRLNENNEDDESSYLYNSDSFCVDKVRRWSFEWGLFCKFPLYGHVIV